MFSAQVRALHVCAA